MRAVLDWAREHAATPAGPAGKRFFLALGLALVSDFALAAKREAPPLRSSADAVARLDTIIRRDFAQPLTLGDLARRAGVSPQHLLKLCRAHHAPTPLEQLYRRRLDAASEWLAGTGLSIGEIADRCGFANQFHFSRRFRQAHGRSPRAWRKRAWGG
jgi:AraC-like DNA-binding protein